MGNSGGTNVGDNKMITKIWYSTHNGGDGSAYPVFMESKVQAKIDQKYMDEGWAEDCYGCIEIKSESFVYVKDIITIDEQIKEVENELAEDYMKKYKAAGKYPEWFGRLEGKLKALKKLKDKKWMKTDSLI